MPVPDLRFAASLIEQGQTAKARRLLERLVTSLPSYVAAYVLLARLAESELRLDDALMHWQDAYAIAPSNQVISFGLEHAAVRLHSTAERKSPEASTTRADDLDRLIEELETARIVPNPNVESIPDEDLQDQIEDVVSETLARIYASQKYFDEAARVYLKLAAQQPDRAKEFKTKADEMNKRAHSAS